MSNPIVKKVKTKRELLISQKIRRIVFCNEQKVSKYVEFDGLDYLCEHFLIYKNNKPVGTARLRVKELGVYKIERVAILKSQRLKGLGKSLVSEIIGIFKKKLNSNTLILHSQVKVKNFYQKIGFKAEGEEFFEDGIMHVKMILKKYQLKIYYKKHQQH